MAGVGVCSDGGVSKFLSIGRFTLPRSILQNKTKSARRPRLGSHAKLLYTVMLIRGVEKLNIPSAKVGLTPARGGHFPRFG